MTEITTKRDECASVSNARWAAYAAAGAASALACGAAEAAVTHVIVNQALDASPGPAFSTAAFAVGNASSGAILFGHSASGTVGAAVFAAAGSVSAGFGGFVSGPYKYVTNAASGQNVSTLAFQSGTGTMAFVSGFGNSQFLDPGVGYIGFTWNGGAGSQYGWVRVDMSGAPLNAMTIIDYAWADLGESISVGQTAAAIPLPGSLGLLASGAAGLLGWRKRRKAAVVQNA